MKSGSKRFTFELETDLPEDSLPIDVEVYVTAEFSEDRNYGADADGNRGVTEYFLESWNYEIESCIREGETVELTEKQVKELKDKISEVVDDIDFD